MELEKNVNEELGLRRGLSLACGVMCFASSSFNVILVMIRSQFVSTAHENVKFLQVKSYAVIALDEAFLFVGVYVVA